MAKHTVVRRPNATARREAPDSKQMFSPRVDIIDTKTELLLFADLPGVSPQDIDLRYEQGELVLHGKVAPSSPRGQRVVEEYEVGDFHRVFQIHESIDATKIEAEYKNGVLIVHLPKQASVQPKQVQIKTT